LDFQIELLMWIFWRFMGQQLFGSFPPKMDKKLSTHLVTLFSLLVPVAGCEPSLLEILAQVFYHCATGGQPIGVFKKYFLHQNYDEGILTEKNNKNKTNHVKTPMLSLRLCQVW
jgi:hypothetical protein